MAIRQVGQQTSLNKLEYQIETGDSLPTGLTENNNGSICTNLNNGEIHVWHIDKWISLGGGASMGILFAMTGGVTLQNSSLETSMLDGGIGDKVISANSLKAGDILEFYWFSRLTCGTSQSATIRLKLGGVILKEHTAALPNNLNDNMFEGNIKIVILSEGVGGTCRISGSSEVMQNNLTGLKRDLGNNVILGINTTIDNTFDFTYQWATASTGNIHTSYTCNLVKE